MVKQEVILKVAEAIQDDVNKGIIRLDSSFMKQLDANPGDVVEIEGERKTVGIVDRAYPGDIGLDIIRMDGLIRRNAKTGLGESVKVRKADVKEAKKITIAPARKGIVVKASPNTFKRGLLGRAVVKGDIVSLGGTRRRRSTMTESPFFQDIFSMADENFSSFFADLKFIVAGSDSKDAVIITENTEVILNPEAVEVKDEYIPEVTYEDIGGLDEELKKIREMVELPLKHPELFERLGIEPPKGVLMHGPPGTGKTLLAKAVANETHAHFILINGPEIMSKFYGESEANLRKKFEEAEKNAPSIIFIDEIDAIATKREEAHGEVEKRVVAQLLSLMDGLQSRGKVIVIAASNIPNALDPALRRPGRFDRELEIGVPSMTARKEILKIHTRNMPINPTEDLEVAKSKVKQKLLNLKENIKKSKSKKPLFQGPQEKTNDKSEEEVKLKSLSAKLETLEQKSFEEAMHAKSEVVTSEDVGEIQACLLDDLIERVATITHGFVGADLSALTKEAAMIVLRRVFPDLQSLNDEQTIPKEVLDKLVVSHNDFYEALKVVRPSAMREVLVEVPDVPWSQVGGMEKIRQELNEAVDWPLKNPEAFKNLGIKPPKGVLLYGPPGTGKTLLAKAVATESKANFISIKGPELLSKWVGESEKAVREVFKKARQTSPTIIFFDELDAIAPRRDGNNERNVTERVVNQLLTEMDGLVELHDVVVIAATNRPDVIDAALLRPGRFDRIVLTPVPDEATRLKIFEVHTKKMPLKGVDLSVLASQTQGYVGADIEAICREAAIFALRKDINVKQVTMQDFEEALKKVHASVNEEIKEAYENLESQFRLAKGKEMKKELTNYYG